MFGKFADLKYPHFMFVKTCNNEMEKGWVRHYDP